MTILHQTLMTGVSLKLVTKCGYCSIWTFVCDTETSLRNKLKSNYWCSCCSLKFY